MPYHSDNNNRHGGGRKWSGGGFRGDNRFSPRGGYNGQHGGRDNRHGDGQALGHTACSEELKKLLGGELFPECKSVSLRLDKFVTIGNKKKLDEIDAVVKLHNKSSFKTETFAPRPDFAPVVGTLRSNLIINQAAGVLENAGISIHPHFNVPFLPGSAVKGVARHAAWLQWKGEPDGEKKKEIANRIAHTFGYPTGDKGLDSYLASADCGWKGKAHSGSVVFMAAFPCDESGAAAPAALAVDILTPHGGNDWTDPVPNPFPVVKKGTSFKFFVGPAGFAGAEYIDSAVDWLKQGLSSGGLGAKTAAGYGVFEVKNAPRPTATKTYTLRLVSPAFLRGAEGDEGTLRESSLRGVLRYWWRILFRSVLSETDLKMLETKIWGGAGKPPTASQIVIRLGQSKSLPPVLFDKESFARKLPTSFQSRRFDRRQNREVVTAPGLAYASYGMDDSGRRRKVLLPGAEWSLEVSFRSCGDISADVLAFHLELALKALCTFGGIGSKSRKGFGSLDCGMELDVGESGFWDGIADALAPFGLVLDPDKAGEYSFLSEPPPNSLSVSLGTRDAWAAVDRIGYAMQTTATSYKHKKEKAAAGLPRKIHGPLRDRPLGHQRGFWKPAENLHPEGGSLQRVTRFASPLFVHVAPGENGNLKVNAIVFPSGLIRPVDDSCEVLEAYLGCLQDILQEAQWN